MNSWPSAGSPARRRDAPREAAAFLAGIRTDLHLEAGRASDELTRDQQARIATARGIEARDGLLGVERFMRDYIGHTRGVKRIAEAVATATGEPRAGRLAGRLLGHRRRGAVSRRPGSVGRCPASGRRWRPTRRPSIRLLELGLLHGLPIDAGDLGGRAGEVAATQPRRAPRALAARPWRRFSGCFLPPARAAPQWQAGLADLLRRLHEVGVLGAVRARLRPCPRPAAVQQLPQVHRRRALHPGGRTVSRSGRRTPAGRGGSGRG